MRSLALLSALTALAAPTACERQSTPTPSSAPVRSGPPPAPPDPDTSGSERLIAEKIAELRRAVIARPESAATWGRLGMTFDIHNLVEPAAVCYAEAERLDPADFRWPYMLGLALPDADPGELIAIWERARRLRPNYVPLNLRLGRAYLQADRHDDAEACFALAARLEPSHSHALLGLAQVAVDRNDPEAARSWLERAAAANPAHREVLSTLARVYRTLGMADEARAVAEQAARIQRNTAFADPVLREKFHEGVSAALLVQQASQLRQQGRPDEAISKLRLSLSVDPASPEARTLLGLSLLQTGRREEGLAELREAIRLDSAFVPAREALEHFEHNP